MTGLQTEFAFRLPKGFVDSAGTLHVDGLMRLATARDEIEPLRDPRIAGPDDPYLTIAILARVITRLGTITDVTPQHVESLFAADHGHLQDLYGVVNFGDAAEIEFLQAETAARFAEDDALREANSNGASDGVGDEAGSVVSQASESEMKPPSRGPRVRSRIEEVSTRRDE